MDATQEIEQVQTIARVETLVLDMHHRLFGNGQPGVLAEFEKRLATVETARSELRGVARFMRWSLVAAPAVLGVVEYILHRGLGPNGPL